MPPDHPQYLSDLDGRAFPQIGQALHQLAGLGRAERADGHLMEVGLHARDGVAAGEEQSTTRRTPGQHSEEQADVGVEEVTAAHGEVLLEVVEHQHHRIFGKGLAEEVEACSVVEVCRQQQGGLLLQLGASGFQEHCAKAGGDRPQVEATRVSGHPPAVLLEPLHHAPGHRALAHAAQPGEDDAGVAAPGCASSARSRAAPAAARSGRRCGAAGPGPRRGTPVVRRAPPCPGRSPPAATRRPPRTTRRWRTPAASAVGGA